MTHPFKGAGVALVTPFKEDNSIDFSALENIVEDQIRTAWITWLLSEQLPKHQLCL